MDIHPSDIIISIINIVVLFILLRLILWKYVIRYLNERKKRVQDDLDKAKNARSEAESLKADYKKRLSSYETQGSMIIQDCTQKASEQADKIIIDAKEAADKLMKDAEIRIEMNRKQAVIDAKAEIAQIATDMAASILMREVSPEDNERTVNEFFSKNSFKPADAQSTGDK